MPRHELRKPIDTLLDEKNKLDRQLTDINDRRERFVTEMQTLRQDQFSYRQAKETLPNTVQHKPAKRVYDQKIVEAQRRVDEIQKELEQVEKDHVVIKSRAIAISRSLKELQNS